MCQPIMFKQGRWIKIGEHELRGGINHELKGGVNHELRGGVNHELRGGVNHIRTSSITLRFTY